ncbi:MAG: guanylate kinase [Fibrobacter sp.]|nr:guanylate kinase [Fibrobacter sp.]
MSAQLFVMSAASGAGKTTLKDHILKHFPQIEYSISATTRPPRPGEENGKHYFFHSVEDFKKMIANQELVEWNLVHGNYYGTPKQFVADKLEAGISLIFDIDVFGKPNFDLVYPQAVGLLILPPNLEVLEERLRARGSDSEEVIKTRLENARKEIEFAHKKGKYEHTIINDDLAKSIEKLSQIISLYL